MYRVGVFFWILGGLVWLGGVISIITELIRMRGHNMSTDPTKKCSQRTKVDWLCCDWPFYWLEQWRRSERFTIEQKWYWRNRWTGDQDRQRGLFDRLEKSAKRRQKCVCHLRANPMLINSITSATCDFIVKANVLEMMQPNLKLQTYQTCVVQIIFEMNNHILAQAKLNGDLLCYVCIMPLK